MTALSNKGFGERACKWASIMLENAAATAAFNGCHPAFLSDQGYSKVAHCHRSCMNWQPNLFFLFLKGYRGIVHPPSGDEGNQRTWFEPEQRPSKRVPKRSVHGKQSPQGASKRFCRRDDQPWWQGWSCHDTSLADRFCFFLFLGYRGIVHPPSDDGGTEWTWFVPERRPRKHFLSDQFKASKISTLSQLVLT